MLKLVFILALLFLFGCAGPVKNMREIPDEQASYAPKPGCSGLSLNDQLYALKMVYKSLSIFNRR